jgi:hypothetical protein
MESKVSVQAVKVPGPGTNDRQLVVRRVNWKEKTEATEHQTVRNFYNFVGPNAWTLEKGPEEPVDIRAKSPDGNSIEDFQIRRLWSEGNFASLSKGAVDKCYTDAEAIELFCKALQDKGPAKYPTGVRNRLILLIDANPIESVTRFLDGIHDKISAHAQIGYKAVWAVGTTDSLKLA